MPGVHPVHVASQRVDLTVVAQVSKGMRQLPGRKVLVEKRWCTMQRALEFPVRQVDIETGDLRSQQQTLVNNGPRRQRGDVEDVLSRISELAISRSARLRTTYSLRSSSS